MGSRLGALLRGRFLLWWLIGWIPLLLVLVGIPVTVWLACFAEPWWSLNGFFASAWLVLNAQVETSWVARILWSAWALTVLLAMTLYFPMFGVLSETLIWPLATLVRRLGGHVFTVGRRVDPLYAEQVAWAKEHANGFWLYGDGLILFTSDRDAVYYKLRWIG